MSGTVNKVILIGYLDSEPQVSTTNDGFRIVSFNLITSESWKEKSTGKKITKKEMHNIKIFNTKICEFAEQYLRKGRQVYIEGSIRTSVWTKDGAYHTALNIVIDRFNGALTAIDSNTERSNVYERG